MKTLLTYLVLYFSYWLVRSLYSAVGYCITCVRVWSVCAYGCISAFCVCVFFSSFLHFSCNNNSHQFVVVVSCSMQHSLKSCLYFFILFSFFFIFFFFFTLSIWFKNCKIFFPFDCLRMKSWKEKKKTKESCNCLKQNNFGLNDDSQYRGLLKKSNNRQFSNSGNCEVRADAATNTIIINYLYNNYCSNH